MAKWQHSMADLLMFLNHLLRGAYVTVAAAAASTPTHPGTTQIDCAEECCEGKSINSMENAVQAAHNGPFEVFEMRDCGVPYMTDLNGLPNTVLMS